MTNCILFFKAPSLGASDLRSIKEIVLCPFFQDFKNSKRKKKSKPRALGLDYMIPKEFQTVH